MKPSEILDAAAALIEPRGAWLQGRLSARPDGGIARAYGPDCDATCWCAEGAIAHEVGSYITEDYRRAEAWLVKLIGYGVATWNDRPGRTQADVVATLREAANLARIEGQ